MYFNTPKLYKSCNLLYEMHVIRSIYSTPCKKLIRFCHFGRNPSLNTTNSQEVKLPLNKVGIFWDLENKPPNTISPFEVANKLRKTVSSFGIVRYMVAYANRHAFSYVPPAVKEVRNERKVLNHLEKKGVIKANEPYVCRVCGRNFNINEKLIAHFKIHEREHQKRLSQIEAAKGKKRVALVGKYAVKMEKYKKSSRDVLIPKVGYGLAEDLKRAGFWVKMVSDKPQAADVALRNHMVDLMDRRQVQCLVLVSDDSDFLGVLKEARERCLKTVVVGDNNDGVLKRNADASFSWRDIIVGKARTEAGSVVGRWRDRDILKKLEWTYDPEVEKDANEVDALSDSSDFEDAHDDVGCGDSSGEDDKRVHCKDDKPWWQLDSNSSS